MAAKMTGRNLRTETRNTVILVVIFVAALLLVYFNETNINKEESVSDVDKPYLFGFNPEEIMELEVTDKNGNILLDIKKVDGRWMAFAPQTGELNSSIPMELLSKIALVRSNRVISGQMDNLATYGLQTPSLSFNLLLFDGSRPVLRIGGESPNKLFRYAMTGDNDDIYMIPSNTVALIDEFTKQLFDAIPED